MRDTLAQLTAALGVMSNACEEFTVNAARIQPNEDNRDQRKAAFHLTRHLERTLRDYSARITETLAYARKYDASLNETDELATGRALGRADHAADRLHSLGADLAAMSNAETRKAQQRYEFEPYDVLQSRNADGEWLDFMTIRTEQEGFNAVSLVIAGKWNNAPAIFRIVNMTKNVVKYPFPNA